MNQVSIAFFTLILSIPVFLLSQPLSKEELREKMQKTIVLEKIHKVENNLISVEGLKGAKRSLRQQMEELKIPSVSIAVIENGAIEWAKAYGVLKAKTNQMTDTSTLFQVESIFKTPSPFPSPLSETNIACNHSKEGKPLEQEASGVLWTTPTNLAKFLIAIQEEIPLDFSKPGTVVEGEKESLKLSYKGHTDGFACAFVSFPHLKKGAVVMVNANHGATLLDEILESVAEVYHWPIK